MFLKIINEINNKQAGHLLFINGQPYGEMKEHIAKSIIAELSSRRDIVFSHNGNRLYFEVEESKLTELFDSILRSWREDKKFECLLGWRNETYECFTNTSSFHVERSGIGLFGLRTFGCHLNGYTRSEGVTRIWIQKRASTKQTYPGVWDNLAAGGLSSGFSARETMIKEAGEEAGVPLSLAQACIAVGIVSFWGERKDEVEPGTVYCYDLLLPDSFVPVPEDGEVDEFKLVTCSELIEMLKAPGKFTPEAFLVSIDFLVRHGLFTSKDHDYLTIVSNLRVSIPFPPRHE